MPVERIRRTHHRLRTLRRHGRLHPHEEGHQLPDAGCRSAVDFDATASLKAVYELPYRGFGKPGRLPHVVQANEFNANQWVDETEVPVHARSRRSRTTGCACA